MCMIYVYECVAYICEHVHGYKAVCVYVCVRERTYGGNGQLRVPSSFLRCSLTELTDWLACFGSELPGFALFAPFPCLGYRHVTAPSFLYGC